MNTKRQEPLVKKSKIQASVNALKKLSKSGKSGKSGQLLDQDGISTSNSQLSVIFGLEKMSETCSVKPTVMYVVTLDVSL